MHTNPYSKIVLALASVLSITPAFAVDIMINGTGKAPITQDIALTRQTSLIDAKRNAVLNEIKKINGAEAANDPKIMGKLDEIAEQIGTEYIFDQSSTRDAGNNFVTTLKLKLDDKEFRKLISDHGVAVKTANSFPILIVMDEFFTTPTDKNKPLREVVEMFSDKSVHVKADESSSDSSLNMSNSNASASLSASANRSIRVNDYDGQASAHSSASVNAQAQSSQQQYAKSSSASSSSYDASKNDVQSYKKVVEYQPQNVGPDKTSFTYEGILREAASYDLNVLDNSQFRSKYFSGKPLTLQELTDGQQLDKYVKAAWTELKADYFMAGTSIIYDNGKNPSSGLFACDGVISLKAYSSANSKVVAADSRTESATGNSPDACRVNVANKLATFTASVLGHDISEYWKNRNMYGQQYTIQLVSLLGQMNFKIKKGFGETINKLTGVKDAPQQRSSDAKQIEYSLQYSGDVPISDAIGELISNADAFKAYPNFDISTSGTTIKVCLEATCPAN